jgi:adenosylcobinamide-GDP ribazoletransferase
MRHVKRFLLMLQFMTTIPLRFDLKATPEDYGKGLAFAPAVGLVIGGILAGCRYAFSLAFPLPVTAVLVMVAYILLTGGLHLDGLGDAFDGLFSGRSRERMLEIMRDSRVGTNAVLAVTSVLLLDTAALYSLQESTVLIVLLLFPVAGRVGSLVSAGISEYARAGGGLGKSFIDSCGMSEIAVGLVLHFLIFFLAAGPQGLIAGLIPVFTAFVFTRLLSGRIGGATGDILGAVCEINQTLFLLAVLLLERLL